MLHGLTLDRRSLIASVGPVFERRTGYRRIHVDLPGFGASPAVPEIASSDAMVDFVLRLIDQLIADTPFVMVGESWGGYLARGIVARLPARVLGVALLCQVVIATHADRNVPDHRLLYEEADLFDGADQGEVDAFREIAVVADRASWATCARGHPATEMADGALSSASHRRTRSPRMSPGRSAVSRSGLTWPPGSVV
jgi:pimeloyl-ACP methyl ester carboxylesterase